MQYNAHELATIFPPMSDDQYQTLVQDIEENGLLHPIILHEKKILDGVHRYKACEELNAMPRYVNFGGGDPLKFVLSMNLSRRHLDASQRAMVAANIANMRSGARTDKQPSANLREVSIDGAAKALGVSARSVTDAKKVITEGSEELKKKSRLAIFR